MAAGRALKADDEGEVALRGGNTTDNIGVIRAGVLDEWRGILGNRSRKCEDWERKGEGEVLDVHLDEAWSCWTGWWWKWSWKRKTGSL